MTQTTMNSEQAAKANAATYVAFPFDLGQRQGAMDKIRRAHSAYLLAQYAPAELDATTHEQMYDKAWNEAHHGGYYSHDAENDTTHYSATEFEYTCLVEAEAQEATS